MKWKDLFKKKLVKPVAEKMDYESDEEKLYKVLNSDEYKNRPYEYSDLSEGMAVINETMWGWWKPRFLINHNTKRAYEFMDKGQSLVTVTTNDIDWDSLKNLPKDAIDRARALSFHFPSSYIVLKTGWRESAGNSIPMAATIWMMTDSA